MKIIWRKIELIIVHFLRSDLWLKVEPYLSLAPTLIGWVIPLLKNKKDSQLFLYSFQHMTLFVLLVLGLVLNATLSFINPFHYSSIAIYTQSLLSALYIDLAIVSLVRFLKKQPYNNSKMISLIAKLNL